MVKAARWIRSIDDGPVSLPSMSLEPGWARLPEPEVEDGPVSLPRMQLEPGQARRLDQERWVWREAEQGRRPQRVVEYGADVSGGEGSNALAGGAGNDPIAKRVVNAKAGGKTPVKLPEAIAEMKRGDLGAMIAAKLPLDIESVAADPSSTEVGDSKMLPVPGNGLPPKKDEVGPNGKRFSDGRYAPKGGFRGNNDKGKPIAHYGLDLSAPIGQPVQAAEDGEIYAQGTARGFGNYTAIRHSDGRIGIYAHLSGFRPMRDGTKVVQGQEIGNVGTSGNAANKGSHLHFEVREDRGIGKTLVPISQGAVAIDPDVWLRTRRVAR